MLYSFVKDRLQRGLGVSRANEHLLQTGLVLDLDRAAGANRPQRAGSFPSSEIDGAFASFRRDYPTYDSTATLDMLRATDYARLDQEQQVYLDYTGGGLFAASQLRTYMDVLNTHVFGNPHSSSGIRRWTNPRAASSGGGRG